MRTKEQIQKYQREWRSKNKEYLKEYNKRYSKKYYQENKDRLKPIRKNWENNNPIKRSKISKKFRDVNKECINKKAKWFKDNYPDIVAGRLKRYRNTSKGKFNTFKSGAKRRNLEIDITYNYFKKLLNEKCIYCGSKENIGIDRIDNNIGYIKENIESCCVICNMMKKTASKQDFLSHIEKIYNHNH